MNNQRKDRNTIRVSDENLEIINLLKIKKDFKNQDEVITWLLEKAKINLQTIKKIFELLDELD